MKNKNSISGMWSVTEAWIENGQKEIEEYEVHIKQDGQSISMDIEGVGYRASGELDNGNIAIMRPYIYEEDGIVKISGLKVAFSEDCSCGEHKNCKWEWWRPKSRFNQNKRPDQNGTSDGKWRKGALYVHSKKDIIDNLKKLEKYKDSEREFYNDRIQAGRCFVVYRTAEVLCFAPSKFVGYRDNNMKTFLETRTKIRDGRETNKKIEAILGQKEENGTLEKEYWRYCIEFCGGEPDNKLHTFWYTDIYI